MRKIMIIGCPGSGKSTFARALAQKTGLPLYHLDRMYWKEDRTIVDKQVFYDRLTRVLAEEEWIVDGNYASTMALRMEACDTVFFLDYPTEVCLQGIRERRGKPRSDMPWIETEEDAAFVGFVEAFRDRCRPQVEVLLKTHSNKNIFVFQSREEGDLFLRQV